MLDLEKAKEPQLYKFSWEIIGYDCGLPKICSPTFMVNFEVTEWCIELDLSQLKNIACCIPARLQRVPGIGPSAVTLDVKVTGNVGNAYFVFVAENKTFNEKGNFFDFSITIPFPILESIQDDVSWLTSKNLLINVEMQSSKKSKKTDGNSPKKYWHNNSSLNAVRDSLKKLHSDKNYDEYHDLILKVPGKEFKLHKCILNARWPELASTLEIGKSPDKMVTKEFSGIPQAILEHLLDFVYYGDMEFMDKLDEVPGSIEIFDLVRKYNFYRVNDQLSQLSPNCSSSQTFQSYRTSVGMKFTNVTSTETAMGDFRTCEIPLKPKRLPVSADPIDVNKVEKFQRHIRFMDLRVYVDKGPYGYNWLMFSIVLGKIPQDNPVTIECKLYVLDESDAKHLLTEQHLVFDKEAELEVTTAFSKNKTSKRYRKTSEPVITWEELIDERKCFMRKRLVNKPSRFLSKLESEKVESSDKPVEEKDIYFRLELKLADGENLYDMMHGECEFMYEFDYKMFEDLKLMLEDDKFSDIYVTSGDKKIKAHKAILAARSTKLFKAIQANPTSLDIKIKPEYLEAFLHYLYTGQIQEVPENEIDHLISVADIYEMKCLEDVLAEKRD